MRKKGLVVASEDRTLPATHAGTLPPNYFCRGWNPRREKYCGARAGKGTAHPGKGRCKFHGGVQTNDKRVTHGQQLSVATPRLEALIRKHEADTAPLDLLPQLARAKALFEWSLERLEAAAAKRGVKAAVLESHRESLIKHVDTISKIVYRLEQVRAHGTISYDQVRMFLLALDRAVDVVLADLPDKRNKLREQILAIRL